MLLEAMLAGVPVAATRVSAVPEGVAHGATGLLVEPGDWRGLGRALARLLADPPRGRHGGGCPRTRSERVLGRADDRADDRAYERL